MSRTAPLPLKRRLFNSLDRRVDRRLLAYAGSVLVSAKHRTPCRVRYDGGDWIHRYPDGTVVNTVLGGLSAADQDRVTRDTFLFGYQPRPGDTIVDIGAGVGSEVRLFSRLVGLTGRVVSVEAHPRIVRCLRRTVMLNGLGNVTVLDCAVVGEPGPVLLEDDLTAHGSNGLTVDPAQGIRVDGRTLDGIVGSLGIDRIDLLKMNIEGAELPALAGSADALTAVDNIVVSCHDFKADRLGTDWQRTFEPVRDLLLRAGFTLRSRPTDPRPWIRCYLYGSRRPAPPAAGRD